MRFLQLDVERQVHDLPEPKHEPAVAVLALAAGGARDFAAPEAEQNVDLLARLGEVQALVQHE